MSQEYYNASATLANVIVEKILPWHKVQFVDIGNYDLELTISEVPMRAQLNKNNVPFLVLLSEKVSQQDEHLVEHLNGILLGKVRNDAGELVDKKDS